MDNVSLILIIFLIAAINTFIVATAIHLIYKIRNNRERKTELVIKEEHAEPKMHESSQIKKEIDPQTDFEAKTIIEDEKKEEISKEKGKEQPKFLKYTSKGYIDPENDVNKGQHTWR